MERKRSSKAKSLKAAGQQKSVNKSNLSSFESELNILLSNRLRTFKGLASSYSPMKLARTTRRFVCDTNFTGTFLQSDGHGQFLTATSATTCATFVDMWRIRRIRVYARNNESDYPVQVTITPSGTDSNINAINSLVKIYAVESQSSASAMIMELKPGLNQLWGMWHKCITTASSSTILTIACSTPSGAIDANTIFEFDFEYLLNIVGGLQSYTVSGLSGLTVGTLYGSSACAGLLAPLDVNKAF
jgi:hypothetical protein